MKQWIAWLLMFTGYLPCSCTQPTSRDPEQAAVRNFYVSNSGNDSSDGGSAHPWKTLARLNSARLSAGDTVFLGGGQVFEGSLLLKEVNGSDVHPVVVTSYGNGHAVINAQHAIAVQLDYCFNIEISKLILLGAGRKEGNTTDGIALSNSNAVKIDSLEITGFQNAGLAVYSCRQVSVTHVNAKENGYAGISVMGEKEAFKKSCYSIYIGYCNAENNPGSPAITNNHSGNGIVAGYCTGVTIEHCVATNNGWDMPRIGNGPVGIWLFEADSSVIQYCSSHHNKTSKGGEDGGGYDLDGGVTNSTIQYCESYNNEGSGYGLFQYKSATRWYNNTIRFSTSKNDGLVSAAKAGIYIWNEQGDAAQFSNCSVHDNTIYNEKVAAICFSPLSIRSGFHFYNNKLTGKGNVITNKGKPSDDVFDNNELKPL